MDQHLPEAFHLQHPDITNPSVLQHDHKPLLHHLTARVTHTHTRTHLFILSIYVYLFELQCGASELHPLQFQS